MLEQIKYNDSPNVPQNGKFSKELFDFVDRCLKKEPYERDSAVSLLAHPWILNFTQSEANLPKYI